MARVQASDVNRRRLGDHIPLHADRERAIVGAFHINSRNAAEVLRRQTFVMSAARACGRRRALASATSASVQS